MRFIVFVLCTLVNDISNTESIIDVYDYKIASEGHVFEGFVLPEVDNGSRISISKKDDEIIMEGGKEIEYLRLKISRGNASMTDKYFNVADTDGFVVDEDGYLIVNNTDAFSLNKEIEFYVVLLKRPENKIISNPLPFVVRLSDISDENGLSESETTSSNYKPAAAVFAGTLILIIVAFALLIPFIVRVKRRYKEGKPVFKLGSHPSSVDSQSQRTFRQISSEPNWYGNTVFNYEDEVEKGKSEFTKDILQMSQKQKNSRNDGTSDLHQSEKCPMETEGMADNPVDGSTKELLKTWTVSSIRTENEKNVDQESKL